MKQPARIVVSATLSRVITVTALFAAEPSKRAEIDANAVGIWKSYAPHRLRTYSRKAAEALARMKKDTPEH